MKITRTMGYGLVALSLVLLIVGYQLALLWAAVLGAALFVAGAAAAFIDTKDIRDQDNNPVTPWYFLLSEPNGGYSLGRMQFIIWFVPAFAMYIGICFVQRQFVPPTETIVALLGMSTVTGIVASAATPKPPAAKGDGGTPVGPSPTTPEKMAQTVLDAYHQAATAQEQMEDPSKNAALVAMTGLVMQNAPALLAAHTGMTASPTAQETVLRPHLRDLIEDFDKHGDVSRYQYLLLSGGVAAILLIVFFTEKALPNLPQTFWQMIAVSQTAYVGTKIVKTVKAG